MIGMQVRRELQSLPESPCTCLTAPSGHLVIVKELGMDEQYGEVSILSCPECSQLWVRYFYELEAFTASGRWYLGIVTGEQASQLTVENARETLERLSWYYYGGSYFQGRTGRSSGAIY